MNARERIEAVVALEKPDRVPVAPLLDHYAATYCGITKKEFMENKKKRLAAVLRTAGELGPWDMSFLAETANPALLIGAPARVLWPGKDLGEDEIHQFFEFELLTEEDYDLLVEAGLTRFLQAVAQRLYPDLTRIKGYRIALSFLMEIRKGVKELRKMGVEPACGFLLPGPLFEYFSIGRTMSQMCYDIFDRPEKIKAASKRWGEAFARVAVRFSRLAGCNRVFIGLSRSSPSFISPRHFEEFVFPELETIVNILVNEGMCPLFHCDTDWERNLPLFRTFPEKKCILELDGATDIFKAKEIVGDRMCIMGDVPAYLLAFGSKDEVLAYCHRLIEEVGRDGGFILSSGCSIPANAKPENVRALSEAAEEWGWY